MKHLEQMGRCSKCSGYFKMKLHTEPSSSAQAAETSAEY